MLGVDCEVFFGEPVSLLPLNDHIIEILRQEIFSGQLENGLELTQEPATEQLNVSRILLGGVSTVGG